MVDEFDQDQLGHLFEWEGVEKGPCAFFDHPNPMLDFRNVFFGRRGVDVDSRHQRS